MKIQTNNYYERVWEYLLVISPPEEIKKSIGNIKKEVEIKYGSAHVLHSIAHISLVRFLLAKGYERNLLQRLFGFCINSIPFEIMLHNFDVFPRHTLYAAVRENEGLGKLQNRFINLLTSFVSVRNKSMKASRKHHITIAGNLNPAQFGSIANEYKRRQINTSFRAKNIVMLKRPYDEYNRAGCRWQGSHNFTLGYN